jgi:hypothetical protein
MVLAGTLACVGTSSAEADSGTSEAMAIPDLGAPATCEPAPLPTFTDNGCAEREDRVAYEELGSIDPEPEEPEGEVFERHWNWPCTVAAVTMTPSCDEIEYTMTCDDQGVLRTAEHTVLSHLAPQLALAPGAAVQYELDAVSIDECCAWSTSRIIDADGIVILSVRMHGQRDDAFADMFVTTALADFGGSRTLAMCTAEFEDSIVYERAIELTIDGQHATVPNDTAVDLGEYRVLVDGVGSTEIEDFGVSQFLDVLIMRTAP